MTRVDLHLHLLPGVDDGAPDEATAIAHARRMVADGVRAATVTPHVGHPAFPLDPWTIPARTAHLQAALDDAGVALSLRPGGEIHPEALGALGAAELDAVAQGPAGARWVLAEVPFAGVDGAFADAVRSAGARGFGVVIAHPERASGLLDDGGLARLRPLLEAGAVLQVNACSLMGRHGPVAKGAAERLVRSRLAYVIASDAHPAHRGHTLLDGEVAALRAGASRAQVVQLTQANPRFLLRHGLRAVAAPGGAPDRGGRPMGRSLHRARDAARRLRPAPRRAAR
ncbi:MAG TPA: CpsB/CapC family capsule biosynthesis tyrosine phosphatase [Baekduia sp.]|nr:CpsB/CapC family capsule biosynthesis tyrosine phosphatase [Baekduia sp.]